MKTHYLKSLLFVAITTCCNLCFGQDYKTIDYTESTENIANPDRGFYRHTETRTTNYNGLSEVVLSNYKKNEKISLILRVIYLEKFVDSDISNEVLTKIQNDFDIIRNAGLKVILRFAYTTKSTAPYGDAKPDRVLKHIDQLAPIIKKNADVVSVLQAGFIGAWGEWYYTDYYSTSLGYASEADWINRRNLVNALLDKALPSNKMVQVRTPTYKRKLTESIPALESQEAFSNTDKARIGHHNDCFLASPDDYGTYDNIVEEKEFLAKETNYVAMGGETCNPFPPTSECDNAMKEMKRFHWSYLNRSYHPDVLNGWVTSGCMDEVEKYLGYRYVLSSATLPISVGRNTSANISMILKNMGWANTFQQRKIELIGKHISSGKEINFPINFDLRFATADAQFNINQSISVPADAELGTYNLFLKIADVDSTIQNNTKYNIRLANTSMWEENAGLNNLNHSMEITLNSGTTNNESSSMSISSTISKNNIHIHSTDTTPIAYEINDSLGKLIAVGKTYNGEVEISDLPNGIYFIRCKQGKLQNVFKFTKV